MSFTHAELLEIAVNAERHNGAGRDTVLALVAEIHHLRRALLSEKLAPCRRIHDRNDPVMDPR